MDEQDIIRMAHEARFEGFGNGDWVCTTDEIVKFAKLVRDDYSNKHANLWLDRCHKFMLEEREACAKVAEDMNSVLSPEIAAAIRARGEMK